MSTTFVLILLLAAVAGAFGSMLGLGGGLIIIPVATLFLDVSLKAAISAGIICVIATSSAAQTVYIEHGITHTRLSMVLELATTTGAIAGALTAVFANVRVLQALFGSMLLWACWSMRRQAVDTAYSPTGLLDANYVDPITGDTIAYGVRRLPLGFGLSFVAGNVSGLLGIGGGAIKMPMMNKVMGMPLRAAIASSNFMIGVTAATSAAVYVGKGYVEPRVAVPMALGTLVGAQLGPRLGAHMRTNTLRVIMVVALLAFAVQMWWKAVAG